MAHIETWWRCLCGKEWSTQKEAILCARVHVKQVQWAVGKGGKAVRIFANHAIDSPHGIKGALYEADLSDNIEERRRQLAQRSAHP